MKIAIASDLHLEFGKIDLHNDENADVLVLAGDITTARSSHLGFFADVSNNFKHVVYVLGNHEHYNWDFKHTVKDLKSFLEPLKNVYLLERDVVRIDGVDFIGGTMWGDYNDGDQECFDTVKRCMSDHEVIVNSNNPLCRRKYPRYLSDDKGNPVYDSNGYRVSDGFITKDVPSKFSPEDAYNENKKFKDFLRIATEFLGEAPKTVVVTHHTPSRLSCHPRWAANKDMNGAYHNNLNEFIIDRNQIKLWIHGHTHEDYDYMIGNCRVVCNPRGYDGHEKRADNWKLKYVEV